MSDDEIFDDGTRADYGYESTVSENEEEEFENLPMSKLRVQNSSISLTEGIYQGAPVTREMLQDPIDEGIEWNDYSEEEEEENEDIITDSEEEEEEEEATDGAAAEQMLRELETQDQQLLLQPKNTTLSVEKAKHIVHQQKLWEDLLELQIFVNRMLSSIAESPPDLLGRQEMINSCLSNLIQLQRQLMIQNHDVEPIQQDVDDDEWEYLSAIRMHMTPYWDTVLEKWRKKTTQDTTKQFKVVNQSILSQVDGVLLDEQRVKRKAHLMSDESVYDDSKFYQQLLKEYIESTGEINQNSLQQQRKRRKSKLVDRKASKGRKLRYVVHPKLEHFMFPNPKPLVDSTELFRSLFGQNLTMS